MIAERGEQLLPGAWTRDRQALGATEPARQCRHVDGSISNAFEPPAEEHLLPRHAHAMHTIVEDDEENRQLQVDSSMDLETRHQERAVAGEHDRTLVPGRA